MKVLFAYQAPTLIDNLAACDLWDATVVDLGDSTGFDERKLLRTPRCVSSSGAGWVFVCTPLQLQNAQLLAAYGTKICWVMHNGKMNHDLRSDLRPHKVHRIACMSQRNAEQVEQWLGSDVPIFVLRPAYEPDAKWKRWTKDVSWTVKSRPWARDRQALDTLYAVIKNAGAFDHRWYGQGQPNGFLLPGEKAKLLEACSCYVSCLPFWAGFGLTEHECMAAGVPVIGSLWGDTCLRRSEDWLLDDSIENQTRFLWETRERSLLDHVHMCEAQFDYLREFCSLEARRRSIEEFLDG